MSKAGEIFEAVEGLGWPALWQDEELCMQRAKEFLDLMDEFDPGWRNKG